MAEAEFEGLGAHGEVPLQQMDLRHQQMSIWMRRTLVQAVLQIALGSIDVTWMNTDKSISLQQHLEVKKERKKKNVL